MYVYFISICYRYKDKRQGNVRRGMGFWKLWWHDYKVRFYVSSLLSNNANLGSYIQVFLVILSAYF